MTTMSIDPHGAYLLGAVRAPFGASATRAFVDCAEGVRRRGGGVGIMAACIGVGQGIAVAVEVDG